MELRKKGYGKTSERGDCRLKEGRMRKRDHLKKERRMRKGRRENKRKKGPQNEGRENE